MALMTCPECSKEISDQAERCPECAFPIAAPAPVGKLGGTVAVGPAFPRKSILLMLLLSLITIGIYPAIWLMQNRNLFNQLGSRQKISENLITATLVVYVAHALTSLGAVAAEDTMIASLNGALTLASFVLIEVVVFKIRAMMQEHYNMPMSGLGTFFFTVYYLQYKLNRLPGSDLA